jgi:hypothetical protein
MPADGIPRCHSPRTEMSARPVSKGSSKEDYTIPRPFKRYSYWQRCRTNKRVKTDSDVRVGSIASVRPTADHFRSSPNCGHHVSRPPLPKSANSGQCLDPSYYAAGCPTAGSIHQEPASQPFRRFGYGLNVQHSQRSVSTPRASVRNPLVRRELARGGCLIKCIARMRAGWRAARGRE